MSMICRSCGKTLFLVDPRVRMGVSSVCGPPGSGCHEMALRNERWKLSPADVDAIWDELFGRSA